MDLTGHPWHAISGPAAPTVGFTAVAETTYYILAIDDQGMGRQLRGDATIVAVGVTVAWIALAMLNPSLDVVTGTIPTQSGLAAPTPTLDWSAPS
jgi:hypothetical protein